MFFSLGKHPDNRFFEHEKLGSWYFSHDSGWNRTEHGFFKGYFHPSVNHGNFCSISLMGDNIVIDHDKFRSFPLWLNRDIKQLTNLLGDGEQIWADDRVRLTDSEFEVSKIDLYNVETTESLSFDDVLDYLEKNIISKVQCLVNDPTLDNKKIFLSGGVDTLMLLGAIHQQGIHVDLLDHEHFEYDKFIDANIKNIKDRHWAYKQIHHWRANTTLITGSCGDEFFFRGPYAIGLWSAWNDINIVELLKSSTGYHLGYFRKAVNQKTFLDFWNDREAIKEKFPTYADLVRQILNVNANDHQHWHLGNTMTWTPYKDLEITKQILRLSHEDIIKQILDADINKKLIARWNPNYLDLLSETKNVNARQHLFKIFGY